MLTGQAESLKLYASRYLEGGKNTRNRSFFKLIELVIRVNFNRLAALKKSKLTLKKLEDSEGKASLNGTKFVPYTII